MGRGVIEIAINIVRDKTNNRLNERTSSIFLILLYALLYHIRLFLNQVNKKLEQKKDECERIAMMRMWDIYRKI
jgi:hypothetical protein